MIGVVWAYTIPWAVLPLLEIWGRFVPGTCNLNYIVIYINFIVIYQCMNISNINIYINFITEGFLTQCTFDYLTDTFDNHMFVAVIFTCSYVIPMSMIIYYYSQIVSHVVNHEKALREQAKKMNVESLRSNQNQANESAEIRIAKAAITICFLFVASWTPYAILALVGAFGDHNLLTPGVSIA